MKKYLSVLICILLLAALLPVSTGAGMTAYDLGKTTFVDNESVVFVAPGNGTVVIPAAELSASEGDGFRASVLKEGVEALSVTIDGGATATLPEQEFHVTAGDEIIFSADTRGHSGDVLHWAPTVFYQGGIVEAEALINFIDLNSHWAKPYVLPLAEEGIIKGKSVNRFDPDGQITRAEFLTLALKVANLPQEIYEPSYADISENQWFAKTAYAAFRGDLVDGNMLSDGKLLPDRPITREEMTSVIMRVMDVMRGKQVDATHAFTDGGAFSAWAAESIGRAANLGLVTGNPDGSFNPQGNATRGEAAVIFSRLKKILDESEPYTPAGEYSPVYGGIVREDVDVNKIINDAYASGAKEVTIEPGVYRLKASPKGGHLYMEGFRDFTVNAEGVTLLLKTISTAAVILNNCENVTVKGITCDFDKPALFRGQIFNIDPDGFYMDVAVDPGYQLDMKKMVTTGGGGYIFDRDTGYMLEGSSSFHTNAGKVEQLTANTYRIHGTSGPRQNGIEVGDYLGSIGYLTSGGYKLTGCKNVTLENITIHDGTHQIFDIHGEGGNRYLNVKMTAGPRRLGCITDRMVAARGDGLHATCLRTGPQVYDSLFEQMLDDGTNIHGSFSKVAGIEGNKVIIGISGAQSTYWEGDDLRFYSPTTEENSQCTVKTCEVLTEYKPKTDLSQNMGSASYSANKYFAVTLDGKKNFKVGDWVVNRDWTCGGFVYKDSTFRGMNSRAMLIKGGDGLIENCTVSNGGNFGLCIAPEFDWTEAGFSENVVVRNCTFHSSGWTRRNGAGLAVCGGGGGGARAVGKDHDNITVEGCTFYGNMYHDLWMSEGTNFTIRNNTFIKDTGLNPVDAPETIHLENCDNVTVSGNVYKDGRPAAVMVGEKVTNLKQQ